MTNPTYTNTTKMPDRMAFGDSERQALLECLNYYRAASLDPGYSGFFETQYCKQFTDFLGGGYADAVSSGTGAIFVAIAALQLPKGSEVLVSPITDPGTVSAVILNNLVPRLIDSRKNSYNVGVDEFRSRITSKTSAVLIVHSLGTAAPIDEICQEANKLGLRVIEDCSQSHGATLNGRQVGTFGDIACFSTMYRKAHITGGCGGVVYTRDRHLYNSALAYADRGKAPWQPDFNDRDPRTFLFPALNWNIDEISCAVGLASVRRLADTISKRRYFVTTLKQLLVSRNSACQASLATNEDSPFVLPVFVDGRKSPLSAKAFANELILTGIPLNPQYRYLVQEWPWVRPYLADAFLTTNAQNARDNSFCLYLNENYGDNEAHHIDHAIEKIELRT